MGRVADGVHWTAEALDMSARDLPADFGGEFLEEINVVGLLRRLPHLPGICADPRQRRLRGGC